MVQRQESCRIAREPQRPTGDPWRTCFSESPEMPDSTSLCQLVVTPLRRNSCAAKVGTSTSKLSVSKWCNEVQQGGLHYSAAPKALIG
eukprot:1002586-Amorphochlora_amoeboformis.AAC.1